MSLSARRAWIEMLEAAELNERVKVALRKESVDRNRPPSADPRCGKRSLSARRAWIEIQQLVAIARALVSLSARRAWIEIALQMNFRSECNDEA